MSYREINLKRTVLVFLLAFSSLVNLFTVFGDKIEKKIYKKISSFSQCVTLLNATHQIGCTSKRKGNVGVVHYIESDEDLRWLLEKGKHTPYIPLFKPEYFTDDRVKQLVEADKVAGILVTYVNVVKNLSSVGFSPEYDCPNDNLGLYGNYKDYRCGGHGKNSVLWNTNGSGMMYRQFDVPVFALKNQHEINSLVKCYLDHNKPVNGSSPDYPLCGVEMQSFMFAAKDTPTCMRKTNAPAFSQRGFCDALGDYNVWGTLFPLVDNINKDDVIVAAAKLDSAAFFYRSGPGADNDATGVVTLLAAAEVLGRLKREEKLTAPDLKKDEKHIMFAFFQGEAWDYIGSSRMVYDMLNGKFPFIDKSSPLSKVNISNIAYFLELNQVGLLDEGGLWAHSDPLSRKNVGAKINFMLDMLSDFGANANLSIRNLSKDSSQPLPPASFQRFLRKSLHIPGVVVTDHKASYTNKFYNSRFDDFNNLNFLSNRSETVTRLTKLATTVANTLYKLAYNKTLNNTEASETLVYQLLYCYIVTANCSLFKNVSTVKNAGVLDGFRGPFNRYVGIFEKQRSPYNAITKLTRLSLAYFTGYHMNYSKMDDSCSDSQPKDYALLRMASGNICVNATVYTSPALSPAFLLEDYGSTEYSTWTESRWSTDTGIRMFLIADPAMEAVTLALGIVLTLLSVVVTVFMYAKADELFTPDSRVVVVSDVQ